MTSILKKAKRICRRRAKAAISIFLVIVLLATMLFGSFFIEAARILMIRRVVRNAADSAARSALSYYDERLASEYGLFAVEKGVAEEAFERYFRSNILLSGNDGFDILRLSLPSDAVAVTLSKPIWEQDTMIRSMGEYAKYRSVVNNAVGLLEKLKDLLDGGNTSDTVLKASKDAKDHVKELEKDVKRFSNDARDAFHSTVKTNTDRAKNLVADSLRMGQSPTKEQQGFDNISSEINTAEKKAKDGIEQSKKDYEKKSAEVNRQLDNAGGKSVDFYDETSGTWKNSGQPSKVPDDDYELPPDDQLVNPSKDADKEKDAVTQQADRARRQLEEKKQEIERKIEEAKECNREIERHQGNIVSIQDEIDRVYTPNVNHAQELVDEWQNVVDDIQRNKNADPYNYIFTGDLDKTRNELFQQVELLRVQLEALDPESWDYREKLKDYNLMADRLTFEDERAKLSDMKKDINANPMEIRKQEQILESAARDLERSCRVKNITLKTVYDAQLTEAKAQLSAAKDQLQGAKDLKKSKEKELDREKKDMEKEIEKREELIREIDKLYDQIPIEKTTAEDWREKYSVPEKDKNQVEHDGDKFFHDLLLEFQNAADELQKTDNPSPNPGSWDDSALKDALSISNMLSDVFGTLEDLTKLISPLKDLLFDRDALVDAFMFSNYVMETQTFLTCQTSRSNRHFQVGEIEYILAGTSRDTYHSQVMCIAKTLRNIALLRLMINWIYYLTVEQVPPLPPITRLTVTLGRAAIRTLEDMRDLIFIKDKGVENAGCAIWPKLDRVKITYSEHMYIWMLLQACNGDSKANMIRRLRTMMQDTYQVRKWNKEGTPEEFMNSLQTKINAEVKVEVNLILLNLPIFRNMLPKDNEVLNSGKFTIRESVSLSY